MSEILDYSPEPTLVVSPSYRVERASAGLLRAWRCSREQIVGEDLVDALYRGSPTERFDRIPIAFAIETAVSTRNLRLCHAAYTDPNGVPWTARITPIHRDNCLLCLIFDWLPIDEASRILVEAVKDYAIFMLDTRGNIMTWNIGAKLNTGYTKDEIIGKHFSIFYDEEDLKSHKPERELDNCLREGHVEEEGWRYRKDGSRFWANVIITVVYRNGIHVGFGKVTRNLTERKEAEMRLIAAYEESTKLKNDFLANISHEIRTPMHGMLFACSLLLHSDLTEEQLETANIIEESGRVLLQVINDILDYSKLAAGSFSITNEKFEVARVVTSVVRSFQTTVQPGVSLKTDLATDLPKWAEGDALRCRQILENIVGNAGKFTERGYIIVRVSLQAQDTTTHTIMTEVVDTGQGVRGESELKLFQPFTQLDATHQKRRQGTGLGLSISKSLVQLMGGGIGYKPNPEQPGSIFWFTTRLLAAEDNIINQKVLVGMLHAFGFQHITVVSNGAEAVSTLANSPDAFDLCLMDISMPVMNGYEATVQIRNSGSRIPIIALTAYALRGDMERCLEKGINDYLAKPVNRQLLMQKLLKWLPTPCDGDVGLPTQKPLNGVLRHTRSASERQSI
ncbi:sensor histidine kinase/response regulator Fos-1 [Purpureocillium lilacinum]|uniref:Sensor histidine kinase/response regulator Fos-1 n=1 Tax=Purpureocillium lilacinum TaxID=33203 RepID=A0A179FK61_PURLI|nr:sensor histidine kinase/response regulator Fos-1 [Purpureocillium lilacinum]